LPMTAATIAVVVATRNRPTLLARCLRALAEQRRRADQIVVVDDASTPPAEATVAAFADDLPVICIRRPTAGGPARARNSGWPLTETTHVAFTDDDCRPTSGWLAALERHAGDRVVAVGRVEPDPDDGPVRGPLDRTMRVERDDGRYSTCNVMYPRLLLDELRGFDERFDRWGEDTDLGRRALAAGAQPVFEPEALVYHAVHHMGWRAYWGERQRVAEAARLRRLHPQTDVPLGRDGIWLNRDHRNAAQALLGLLATPLTPAGLAFVGRWLDVAEERAAQWPLAPRMRTMAVLALTDLLDVVMCTAGSIRHRALLL
jgi:GT2 family glycosyltransferase